MRAWAEEIIYRVCPNASVRSIAPSSILSSVSSFSLPLLPERPSVLAKIYLSVHMERKEKGKEKSLTLLLYVLYCMATSIPRCAHLMQAYGCSAREEVCHWSIDMASKYSKSRLCTMPLLISSRSIFVL